MHFTTACNTWRMKNTKEYLITRSASVLGTCVERAYNLFASGSIERIKAYGAGHNCSRFRMNESSNERKDEKEMKSIFVKMN